MADQAFPHLSRAPVVEAAIELRARFDAPVADSCFGRFRELLADSFSGHQNIRFIAPNVLIGDEGLNVSASVTTSLIGVRLENAEKTMVVQAKNDGLTVSRMTPYTSWPALIGEVRTLWGHYSQTFRPTEVVRVGARYINRIELPETVVDFDVLFTAGPKVAPALPQGLAQFLTRMVIPIEAHRAILTLIQSFQSTPGGAPAVMLDIDAGCPIPMSPEGDDIWAQLEELRSVKNQAFFGSLHQKAWERYL